MSNRHASDSTQPNDTIRRAARAQAILDDPLVVEALAKLESDCLSQWRHSRDDDRDGRELMFQKLRLIDQLRQEFTSLVLSGRMTLAQTVQDRFTQDRFTQDGLT